MNRLTKLNKQTCSKFSNLTKTYAGSKDAIWVRETHTLLAHCRGWADAMPLTLTSEHPCKRVLVSKRAKCFVWNIEFILCGSINQSYHRLRYAHFIYTHIIPNGSWIICYLTPKKNLFSKRLAQRSILSAQLAQCWVSWAENTERLASRFENKFFSGVKK